MTEIQITPKYSDVKPEGYYVYIHRRSTDGTPFYVGKGLGPRGFYVSGRNRWWKFVARKHGVKVELCQTDMTEYDAFTLEMWIIAKLKNSGIELVNQTDGGEGISGFPSQRRKNVYCSNGMKFPHCQEASDWLVSQGNESATSKIVSAAASGKKRSVYGHAFSYEGFPDIPKVTGNEARAFYSGLSGRKRVYCSNGKSYESGRAASRALTGTSQMSSKILECCNGKRKSACGLTWSYDPKTIPEYEDPYIASTKAKWKRIMCSNGMVFDAIFLAIEWLKEETGKKYTPSAIQQAIKRGGTCGGYKWERLDKKKGTH